MQDNFPWPIRGPNNHVAVDGAMRNRDNFNPKEPANDGNRGSSLMIYVTPDSACHAGGRGLRVPSLPLSKAPELAGVFFGVVVLEKVVPAALRRGSR